ncbi:MAG: hypothetical protein SVE93_04500 [Candidatus Thermoplasmatota archaeon]|nr:hypothetical protein [Candidatus Thermoplasmatota archaeon]
MKSVCKRECLSFYDLSIETTMPEEGEDIIKALSHSNSTCTEA